ncbi:MAG TPA: R3H domain-containing nucleic acid-binding protein [Polyangiaceae bacterium]|nr:R3H domain-containing nucleic acid-binding protein [Polyangiaceae bacterium]
MEQENNTDERDAESAKGDSEPRKSAEPADDRAKQAFEFLSSLISKMQMDCEVILSAQSEEAPNDIHIEVVGPDSGRVIGKKGQVLSAIQFLCNRVVNRPGLERRYVTVDAEGYRSRREDSLATMARRLGKQAMTDGKIITFEPMSPRDRRVVHLALAKLEGVVTRSEGEGDSRRVQIIPVRRQPTQT